MDANDITFSPTNKGFLRSEFLDINGEKCSLQESSQPNRGEGVIWLGIDEMRSTPPCDGRMHLTQSQVKALLPALAYFAEHGGLGAVGRIVPRQTCHQETQDAHAGCTHYGLVRRPGWHCILCGARDEGAAG